MLAKKMFRDIRFNLSQFITIFLMVFIGIMAYSGIRSYMDGMKITADTFYEEQNLQDLEAISTNLSAEGIKLVLIKSVSSSKSISNLIEVKFTAFSGLIAVALKYANVTPTNINIMEAIATKAKNIDFLFFSSMSFTLSN